jgi:polyhydroxybutyrate depolymerase
MSARHLRAAGTLIAGLALLALVAWQSGAKAVHYASDPTHEPCPALTPGDHALTIDTAAGRRLVLLHAPPGAYKPRPLIIAVHGAGQTATEFASSTGFSRLADREDFLVAYSPTGAPSASWNTAALDQLETAVCIDPARVFVAGVSNGGGPTARLACDLSARLAGVASVAGAYPTLRPCAPARPLPVLEIHGTADQVFPYGGRPRVYKASVQRFLGRWRRIDGCHGNGNRLKLAPGVTEVAWRHCSAATRVEHVRLDRRAHGWPRGARTPAPPAPYAATWRAWQFFRSLPPRPPLHTA